MEIVILPGPDEIGVLVADAIERLLRDRPGAVLGLATGSSPLPIYAELVHRYRAGTVSFAQARAFLLDEYVGLPRDHDESYRRFVERNLAELVDLNPASLHGPDGATDNLAGEGQRYEQAIADAGGIDLQLLGIGSDGHIGFNEPSSSLGSRTRLKTLTDRTREDNARFFDDDIDQVPRHVLTQGIGTILEARHLVMVAFGASKAEPIAAAVEGALSASVPGSALQLHPRATVVIDEAAAADLSYRDYYREAYDNKPEWQNV